MTAPARRDDTKQAPRGLPRGKDNANRSARRHVTGAGLSACGGTSIVRALSVVFALFRSYTAERLTYLDQLLVARVVDDDVTS